MTNSNKNSIDNKKPSNEKQHGGKRPGSGRPKGTGKFGEPTKAIRVPEGSISYINNFLENQYSQQGEKNNPINNESSQQNTSQLTLDNVIPFATALDESQDSNKASFPLFSSKVAAGMPSYANDDLDDSIDLNDYLVQKPNSTFMLKVQGMSMRDAGILPDDVLIVDRSKQPSHNKIVIAAVDGELTVKRLFRRGERIKLLPENPDYPEIDIKNESQLVIWGVVVGSFRRFEVTKFS